MTISRPIHRPLPRKDWKGEKTRQLLAALASLPTDHMLEIEDVTDSFLHTTANRYGYRIATRKIGGAKLGVWKIKQPTSQP